MTKFVPVFPLALVVFPGEMLNLHIFEERYKQLIGEVIKQQSTFAIPSILNKEISEWATLVEVTELVKLYADDKMDIRCKGVDVVRILEIVPEIPEKLYSGAIASKANFNSPYPIPGMLTVVELMRLLHQKLSITKNFDKPDAQLVSFDIAHHIGLSLEEEYRLLTMPLENQRVIFLKKHLMQTLKVLNNVEELKKRVQLNGHFKDISSLGFNFSK
ncbi:MAG: LON peptidase substrate-binding domain-containing protein [Chitinophagaceae bacterium]